MNPLLIIQIIQMAAQGLQTATAAYEQIKDTLSETDAKAIHDALLAAEAQTNALRPQVDAALDAAAKS